MAVRSLIPLLLDVRVLGFAATVAVELSRFAARCACGCDLLLLQRLIDQPGGINERLSQCRVQGPVSCHCQSVTAWGMIVMRDSKT
jgi:hypothetical protein